VLGCRSNAFLAIGRLDHFEAGSGKQVGRMRRLSSVSSITRIRFVMRPPLYCYWMLARLPQPLLQTGTTLSVSALSRHVSLSIQTQQA
jgi:hypothetical protein